MILPSFIHLEILPSSIHLFILPSSISSSLYHPSIIHFFIPSFSSIHRIFFINLSLHSSIFSLLHSIICLLFQPFIHPSVSVSSYFLHLLSFIHSSIPPSPHFLFFYSLILPFIFPFIHSFIHSCIHSF